MGRLLATEPQEGWEEWEEWELCEERRNLKRRRNFEFRILIGEKNRRDTN
jgi:hypothetical protein